MKSGRNRRYFTNPIGLNDLLFTLLFSFMFMLILVLKPIIEEKKISEIIPKAEFLIVLEWDKKSNSDLDLWVKGPNGNIIFFRNRESGNMHLDRDDLGFSTDSVTIGNEVTILDINREILTLRGIVPGWYIVNIHFYRKAEEKVNASIDVMKINAFQIIERKEFILTYQGEEITTVRFLLNSEGQVIEKNNLSMKLFSQGEDYARTDEFGDSPGSH